MIKTEDNPKTGVKYMLMKMNIDSKASCLLWPVAISKRSLFTLHLGKPLEINVNQGPSGRNR